MTNSEFSPGFLGMILLLLFVLRARSALGILVAHDLIRKPVSTFRDHSLERDRKQNAGANMTPALYLCRYSGALQIGRGRLAAAPVGFDVERKLLALDQRAHAGALDRGDVHEHVRAARILHDEAVALLGVEELDGTLSHEGPPF